MSHSSDVKAGNRSPRQALKFGCVAVLLLVLGIGAWVSAREYLVGEGTSSAHQNAASTARQIHALGRMEPRGTVLRISAPSGNEGARVERLLVEEGAEVQAGDLLAVLDVADRREAAVREAAARVEAAEAKLDQIRAGTKPGEIAAQAAQVERMEAELESARKELQRAQQLTTQKVLTAENLEQKQLSYERAKLECQRARALLDSLREVREVDIQLQSKEVAAAAASLRRAQAELEAAHVRSRNSGRVLKIHTRPGERISDRGILQLGDVAHMQAVAEVFEGDVQELQLGQPAKVCISSDGRELAGKVEQIGLLVARKDVLSNDPVSDTDARVLEVRIALNAADIPQVERLSNARVEVTIELTAAPSSSRLETQQPGSRETEDLRPSVTSNE